MDVLACTGTFWLALGCFRQAAWALRIQSVIHSNCSLIVSRIQSITYSICHSFNLFFFQFLLHSVTHSICYSFNFSLFKSASSIQSLFQCNSICHSLNLSLIQSVTIQSHSFKLSLIQSVTYSICHLFNLSLIQWQLEQHSLLSHLWNIWKRVLWALTD